MCWIQILLDELEIPTVKPTLKIDNQSPLKLIDTSNLSRRTRHIEVKYHFKRQKYQEGKFEIMYVSTEN